MSSHWKDDLERRLEALGGRKVVIAGLGNRMRGDDGSGSRLAAGLSQLGMKNAIDCGSSPENYCESIAGLKPEVVVVVDAACFGGVPGEVRILEEDEVRGGALTTHDSSLDLFTLYLRNRCGCTVIFAGIQTGSTTFGGGISEPVRETLDRLVELFLAIQPATPSEGMTGFPSPIRRARGRPRRFVGAGVGGLLRRGLNRKAAGISVMAISLAFLLSGLPLSQPFDREALVKDRQRVLDWCKRHGALIRGMTKGEVLRIYGRPDRRFMHNRSTGTVEQWIYNYPRRRGIFPLRRSPFAARFHNLYFKNDILTDFN